jgi:hypothetical protein
MKNKFKLASTLLALTMASSASASIVTSWEYVNQAGFLNNYTGKPGSHPVTGSGDSSGGGTNILDTNGDFVVDGNDSALFTELRWGEPHAAQGNGEQSGLVIDSPVEDDTGSLITGAGFVSGTDIIHENNVISSGTGSLLTAQVLDGLTLTPKTWSGIDYGNDTIYAPQLSFGINFYETPNNANPCAFPDTDNTGVNANGCGDIFEITGLGDIPIVPVFGPDFVQFTVPFFVNTNGWDQVYYLTTKLSGLTILSAPDYECQSGPSCFGFVTKEKTKNTLAAEFKVRVPEPGTIGLFGLALIGTAFAGRRKRS